MPDALRQMSPTENWLWTWAEASQDNEPKRSREVAAEAIAAWQGFVRNRMLTVRIRGPQRTEEI